MGRDEHCIAFQWRGGWGEAEINARVAVERGLGGG